MIAMHPAGQVLIPLVLAGLLPIVSSNPLPTPAPYGQPVGRALRRLHQGWRPTVRHCRPRIASNLINPFCSSYLAKPKTATSTISFTHASFRTIKKRHRDSVL